METNQETLNEILTLINKIRVKQEKTTKQITIINEKLNKRPTD
jgi:hypothetical protein